ncbi:Kinesin-like protein KIF18A [Eumeta japonica]|uniref:Kinesin-like protein KIF18A n=1 Tax=Eumeta variegata TaxID=151549 RepID=A0A4C1Z608_EUMVA|nr:Kinesin-like protein KIF18A [Eumeta japonica]
MVKIEKNMTPFALRSTVQESVPSRCGSTLNMAANIKVVVRVRPPNEKELSLNSRTVIDVVDENMLVFDPKEIERPFFYQGIQQPNRSFLKRANKELKFVFDHVCDQTASNRDVFETAIKDMILSLMEGYNCSVFVYGATGAGKTFTMIGSTENPGITYLTMENLFYTIASFEKDRDFDIAVSYIEVYNENVYDLLKPSKVPLQLREDSKYGVMVAGLTLHNIKTARELLNMLENGNKNRTQHPTDANAESSRSHAVFQVYLKMRYKTSNQSRGVKLSMIDLAGSERAAATGCVGERFKEGANINRSLLSLGNCINKLADGSKYIPYRDSKLTRLLKDSLGGNCKTVMIANISPSSLTYEDTYNTLKYAARANKIQLSVKKNIVDGDTRISQYVKMIDELKTKVRELEAKQTLCQCSSTAQRSLKTVCLGKEKEVVEWRQRITEAVRTHGKLETQLLNLMSRQRVLALRHRLRTQAFARVADMAHRSSTEAMEQARGVIATVYQRMKFEAENGVERVTDARWRTSKAVGMCTEDIPRQERAAESYMRQAKILDQKILTYWTKWKNSKNELLALCNKAVSECPSLNDFVDKMQLQSKLRQVEARDELRQKITSLGK